MTRRTKRQREPTGEQVGGKGETMMSQNQLTDSKVSEGCCSCGGSTWSRVDDDGLYWQCEACGECYTDAEARCRISPRQGRDPFPE